MQLIRIGCALPQGYYFVCYSEEDALGIGHAQEGYEFDSLSENRHYQDWTPVIFTLRDGGYADYQANDLGWPLCSAKLSEIIRRHADPDDAIQWLPARVTVAEREERGYDILHLPKRPDVLDNRRTLFSKGGGIVKPYLSVKAIGEHRVFSYPGGFFRVVVSSEVRDAILSADCTGIDFYKARVV